MPRTIEFSWKFGTETNLRTGNLKVRQGNEITHKLFYCVVKRRVTSVPVFKKDVNGTGTYF